MNIIIRTTCYPDDPAQEAQRQAWAEDLQAQCPGSTIAIDAHADPYEHFCRVLRQSGNVDTMHIEDDAILADQFMERASAVISNKPGSIVQFYSRFINDVRQGSRWERRFVGGVGFFLPGWFAPIILRFLENWPRRDLNPTAWDVAIGHWLTQERREYWLQVPNLIDHRVGPSLVDPSRPMDRRSYTFRRSY